MCIISRLIFCTYVPAFVLHFAADPVVVLGSAATRRDISITCDSITRVELSKFPS